MGRELGRNRRHACFSPGAGACNTDTRRRRLQHRTAAPPPLRGTPPQTSRPQTSVAMPQPGTGGTTPHGAGAASLPTQGAWPRLARGSARPALARRARGPLAPPAQAQGAAGFHSWRLTIFLFPCCVCFLRKKRSGIERRGRSG